MKTLLKIGITLLLLTLIFRHIDARAVFATIGSMNKAFLLMAIGVQFLSTLAASFRWQTVMQTLGFHGNFQFYFRSYFKGIFFNQGLPTTVGGDAIRVLDVAKLGHRKRDAFYGVLIDRVAGLFGLLVLNLAANLASIDLLPGNVFAAITAITLIGIPGIFLLGLVWKFEFLKGLWGMNLLHGLSQRMHSAFHGGKSVVQQTLLAMLIHLLSILAMYFIGHGMGINQSLINFLVIAPPVILLTIIPISIAGWGIREGAMIGLFGMIGADKTIVLSMSILYGLTVLVTSLPGLYFYWAGHHHQPREAAP